MPVKKRKKKRSSPQQRLTPWITYALGLFVAGIAVCLFLDLVFKTNLINSPIWGILAVPLLFALIHQLLFRKKT